jgi:hypothetical protein
MHLRPVNGNQLEFLFGIPLKVMTFPEANSNLNIFLLPNLSIFDLQMNIFEVLSFSYQTTHPIVPSLLFASQ